MRCYIVAEIGINHNGDLDIARRLIDLAHGCGCDAVKFQKRTIETVYPPNVLATPRESPWGTTTRQQKEGLELGFEAYCAIDRHCRAIGIDWFGSAWDQASLEFLRSFRCPHNKIASAMLTHTEFVEAVAREGQHTFISTGMSTVDDVDRAVAIFRRSDCPFTLMHTVSVYPCKEEELNLACMRTLRRRYHAPVGYSGHEVSPMPSIIAAALGAVAIERHITLDRAMYGSDQAASLEARGLQTLVNGVRTCERVMGTGEKAYSDGERAVAMKLRYWQLAATH
jgi:N-acetylneuraminate synthase